MDSRLVVVEGPIAVGKTDLCRRLAERLNARCVLEDVESNPFLPRFYADPGRSAFQAQIYFLLERFKQQAALAQRELFSELTVCDYLFAKDRLFACLTLEGSELALYDRVFEALSPRAARPDLVIFLQARVEVLEGRIRRRGREYERAMGPGYLERLCRAYNDFFLHYADAPVLIVNTSDLDLAGNDAELENLIRSLGGPLHRVPRQYQPLRRA